MANDLSAKLLRPHLGAGAQKTGLVAVRSFRSVILTRHVTPIATWEWGAEGTAPATHHAFVVSADGDGIPLNGQTSAALFLTANARVTIPWQRHADVIVGWVPPAALAEFADVAPDDATPIADSLLVRGLASFATTLVPGPLEPSSIARYAIERLLVEMAFATLLDQNSAQTPDRAPASLLERSRALLLAHRSEREYSTTQLARELHVSVRQVQRAFADVGTTPGDALRRNRVDLAVELLRHPEYRPLAIDEVAAHAGFNNSLQLRRALQAEGMPSPSRLRAGEPVG
jgi:AraC-like DNA-binding protein